MRAKPSRAPSRAVMLGLPSTASLPARAAIELAQLDKGQATDHSTSEEQAVGLDNMRAPFHSQHEQRLYLVASCAFTCSGSLSNLRARGAE